MDNRRKLIVNGGRRLEGELRIHGAKNSALPLLSAAVLAHGETVLHNVPELTDVDAACRILTHLGCRCKRSGDTVTVDAANVSGCEIPDSLMREMRSSIVFLGAVLGRAGRCRLSFPGGCELGARPIDLHLAALRQMGADIAEEHGYLDCTAAGGLHGARITLSFPSVGATENILLAAATAKGCTEIHNAAREPEIVDLADCLGKFGARIGGAGESVITVEGVPRAEPCEHSVIPDRIVAGTYLCAAAVTRGEIILTKCEPRHMNGFLPVLEAMGARIYTYGGGKLYMSCGKRLTAPPTIRTMPYPGFPTDIQAPFTALCATAEGTSVFVETIFENRFRHVPELVRLGASIKTEGRVCVVQGVKRLSGAKVCAAELRGGAALVTAALAAEGTSEITGLGYIDRGYEGLESALRSVGADIKRV
ncbi:MAG: UDP-N-acetylglucosamine 1-carboxyvinyltransferase [Lachnospiraceae bacterium]|nr:UDP-N-acetylglucosamine 1-carboxyvinyltransferase [Ruminococcus sp.]MCM1275937.1 UDP-N-acetylglucosamine 1-carboxyvinyltransferase [Lachnospiraceae bacterium]